MSDRLKFDELMNLNEAASLVGIHPQNLSKLAREKKIPCFKFGNKWKFSKEILEKFFWDVMNNSV
jgi:excisionase family DNA binding protein